MKILNGNNLARNIGTWYTIYYRRRKGLSCVPITYTCPVCGKEFKGLREKYCSDKCRKVAKDKIMHENNKWYYENRKKG